MGLELEEHLILQAWCYVKLIFATPPIIVTDKAIWPLSIKSLPYPSRIK